ncbi:hypothetical protein [Streptomyces bobili]|nr:hypothetical protein [Streptomyces bobili]
MASVDTDRIAVRQQYVDERSPEFVGNPGPGRDLLDSRPLRPALG